MSSLKGSVNSSYDIYTHLNSINLAYSIEFLSNNGYVSLNEVLAYDSFDVMPIEMLTKICKVYNLFIEKYKSNGEYKIRLVTECIK